MERDDDQEVAERLNPQANPSWPFGSEDYIRSSADLTQSSPPVKIGNILHSGLSQPISY